MRSLRRAIGDSGAAEQLLHGEPHPGNVLSTKNGLLFIDLETCCRGPVEFDLAHVPEEVSEHYPGVDQGLLRECRQLVLAMVAAWRWDAGDQFPNGQRAGRAILGVLREVLRGRRSAIPARPPVTSRRVVHERQLGRNRTAPPGHRPHKLLLSQESNCNIGTAKP